MINGDEIKRLIPQRYPMMMVSSFEATGEQSAATSLTVAADNYFLLPGSEMSETGLIEHIAQSASALAGWRALMAQKAMENDNAKDEVANESTQHPPVGLIGEVKRFTCYRRARVGETVCTTVNFGLTFGAATLLTGESRVGDEVIAEANMKIFIQ
jgi:3-hydroxymyristoyl/3-hydroxydecanoyl-(acyl carrier protein) dehydratase